MSNSDQHQFKDRYMLRLPDGMRDRIKAAAEANNRSMNAEIVAALEKEYPAPAFPPESVQRALITLLEALAGDDPSAMTEELASLRNHLLHMPFEKAEHEAGYLARSLFRKEALERIANEGIAPGGVRIPLKDLIRSDDNASD